MITGTNSPPGIVCRRPVSAHSTRRAQKGRSDLIMPSHSGPIAQLGGCDLCAVIPCIMCPQISAHSQGIAGRNPPAGGTGVENRFFGSSVTVAGLLTGGDIARALKGKPLGERLLLPDVMFREGSEEFLDNMTLSGLSEQLKVPVEKIPADGESFVYKLLGVAPQG